MIYFMSNLFKKFCRKIYRSLPVIRELQKIEGRINKIISHNMRTIGGSSVVQALEAIKTGDPRYRDPQRLLVHGAQFWSQNLEDGMIAEIFRRIGTESKTFIEIGVGDGSENNTTALLAAGWSGWWIEGDDKSAHSILERLSKMPSIASRLKLIKSYVQPDDINKMMLDFGIPTEVDLFSLDIDLNTYHIWAALENFRPRVVVVEYNAGIPPEIGWIHPFERDGIWDISQAQGASLKSYELLGRKMGYSLVGCDVIGINAFFVRNDLLSDHFNQPFTSENHYEPPRYFLSYRFGHQSKFYGESATE